MKAAGTHLAILVLLSALSGLDPVFARSGPGDRSPTGASAVLPADRQLISLGGGVRFWMPDEARQGRLPRARRIPAPAITLPGFEPLGTAFELEWDGEPPPGFAEIEFTLPAAAFAEGRRIAFLRQGGGGRGVLVPPARIDPGARTATVLTASFSTWVPLVTFFPYLHANVEGNVSLAVACEEEPEQTWIQVMAPTSPGGPLAGFMAYAPGLGRYVVYPPIPETAFGTYVFQVESAISKSKFWFGSLPPPPSQRIDQVGATYVQDLELYPTNAHLRGTVADKNGQPKEGILVTVHGSRSAVNFRDRTGPGGEYELWFIGYGPISASPFRDMPYTLTDPAEDCPESKGFVRVRYCHHNDVDLQFRVQGDVEGSVLDDGSPLAGADIELVDSTGGARTAKSASDGSFAFEDVPVGSTLVTVSCPGGGGRRDQTIDVACPSPAPARADFATSCGLCDVVGTVSDTAGPLAGAGVELVDSTGGRRDTMTGSGGGFTLADVPAGRATLTATCPNGTSASQPVDIRCPGGAPARADISLACEVCDVVGTVYDTMGPLSGTDVQLLDSAGQPWRTTSGSNGSFAFDDVPSGPATLSATCPSGGTASRPVDVTCPSGAPVTADLSAACSDDWQGVLEGRLRVHNPCSEKPHVERVVSSFRVEFKMTGEPDPLVPRSRAFRSVADSATIQWTSFLHTPCPNDCRFSLGAPAGKVNYVNWGEWLDDGSGYRINMHALHDPHPLLCDGRSGLPGNLVATMLGQMVAWSSDSKVPFTSQSKSRLSKTWTQTLQPAPNAGATLQATLTIRRATP